MARGLTTIVEPDDLTIVVNVGDDTEVYGVYVAADLDTVVYTLAGIEGPDGWGIRSDTFAILGAMDVLGLDTTFRLGDRDLATCLTRTLRLGEGASLSTVTAEVARALGVRPSVLPASDDRVRTRVLTEEVGWIDFQEYFVMRRHADVVEALEFVGAKDATPAPGVIAAIETAARVIIAPSNPPLSVWPILAIAEIRAAVADHQRVIAVSPLIGGKALRGPADRVMDALGLPAGNSGVSAAYDGLIDVLVIDTADETEAAALRSNLDVLVTSTLITAPDAAARLSAELLSL